MNREQLLNQLEERVKLLLIGVKYQEISIFHNDENSTDYIQLLEDTINQLNP